jgi:transposase-like protein
MVETLDSDDRAFLQLEPMLHPDGLACPTCGTRDRPRLHRTHRFPLDDYRCLRCGRVWNAWTGTPLQGCHRSAAVLVALIQAWADGVTTSQVARDLGCDRRHLVELRRRLAPLVRLWRG